MCPSRAGVTQLAECLLPKRTFRSPNNDAMDTRLGHFESTVLLQIRVWALKSL
jgi:hypothetical protein